MQNFYLVGRRKSNAINLYSKITLYKLLNTSRKRSSIQELMNKNTFEVSLESTYKFVRDYVVHEDSLINFRLNWLLVIQGLLFTAYGLTIRELLKNEKTSENIQNIHEFRKVISFVGITTCILIFLSILSAVLAIKNLEAFWEMRNKNQKNIENITGLPFVTGGTNPRSIDTRPDGGDNNGEGDNGEGDNGEGDNGEGDNGEGDNGEGDNAEGNNGEVNNGEVNNYWGDKNLRCLHELQDKLYIAFLSPLGVPLVFLSAWIYLISKF